MKVLNFCQKNKGRWIASFDLELNGRLILRRCGLYKHNGRQVFVAPGEKIDGRFRPCIDFTSREVAEEFALGVAVALNEYFAAVKP